MAGAKLPHVAVRQRYLTLQSCRVVCRWVYDADDPEKPREAWHEADLPAFEKLTVVEFVPNRPGVALCQLDGDERLLARMIPGETRRPVALKREPALFRVEIPFEDLIAKCRRIPDAPDPRPRRLQVRLATLLVASLAAAALLGANLVPRMLVLDEGYELAVEVQGWPLPCAPGRVKFGQKWISSQGEVPDYAILVWSLDDAARRNPSAFAALNELEHQGAPWRWPANIAVALALLGLAFYASERGLRIYESYRRLRE